MAQYNLSYTGAQVDAAIAYATQVPTLQYAITSNATAIATETSQRTTADTNLQSQITENSDDIAVNISEIADLRIHKADVSPTTGATSALRPMFEAVGAVYNSATGGFTLNGIDLSYSEMLYCYQATVPFTTSADMQGRFSGSKIRTNVQSTSTFSGVYSVNLREAFYWCNKLEKIVLPNYGVSGNPTLNVNNFGSAFSGCSVLTDVLGVMRFINDTGNSNAFASAFYNCPLLRTLSLMELAQNVSFASSPNLSMTSLAYMINNSSATSAITITLHSSAYSAAQSDTSVQSALLAKPLVTLAQA